MSRDRHKASPVTFRPPAGDRAWLVDYAKATGMSVGSILSVALRMYRAALERGADVALIRELERDPEIKEAHDAIRRALRNEPD